MASESGGLSFHPMEQFVVKPWIGDTLSWFSISNAAVWFALAVLFIYLLFVVGSSGRSMVPTRIQSIGEVIYGVIYKMVEDICGKDGVKYFPYIFSIFLFILAANLLGLIPYSFTTTSHIAVTALLAFVIFIVITIIGFAKNGSGYLALFWIDSAPLPLRPILFVIEVISYFVRPISHSIRLAGNMMAGHAMIKVFAGFAGAGLLIGIPAILAIVLVMPLELLVAVIQAYVFTILTCVYLADALHPGH